MRIVDIVEGTSVDGPGLRTSVYFAGCEHACPGCHNPQTWPRDAGREMSLDEVMAVIDDAGFNVTLTGGDPLYQIDSAIEVARAAHARGLTVWVYTGFTLEQIQSSPTLRPILDEVDAIVDGPFVMAQRDVTLQFRGSSNQRIILLPLSQGGNDATAQESGV